MGSRLFHRLSCSTLFCRKDCIFRTNYRLLSSLKGGQVVVRFAKASHFDEVLKLSRKLKDTFDYVPYRLHKWLQESNRIPLVAEIGTDVVGFEECSILDGEESVLLEAGRIDPDHRHQGILGLLRSLGPSLIREKFPKVFRTRYTVWSGAYQAVKKTNQKRNIYDEELYHYDFLSYKVEPEHVSFKYKLENCTKLKPCPKEEFKKHILENASTSSLFPDNMLAIDWQPFKAIPTNFESIVQDQDRYFVDSSNDLAGALTSFSLGRFVQLVRGQVWTSTIYAKDSKLCQSHVIHQLTSACQSAKGSFLFSTFQDPSLTRYCKEALTDIPGVTRMEGNEPTQKMFIFEGE
ncbi:histidine N-acetyltransferase-like [Stylophora pistillata]|uniref:histidine N-acetyltransferase-like n=1 Tax=Stylophora pistillata TaxID=50429 RepID=UPI000C052C3F|nr:histidine N-acetyltransferase-like [Stylophora pistillata]